ncbi:hypothetical protein [Desulfofalx alkaliphila]|uniref:hypothetical protein n=1 Tax=Desulfofalx alkaliphila TaxID=105483 RepID=UPI0012FED6EF|nr:hypothetical protein [Desulfofalx alkaliphila]
MPSSLPSTLLFLSAGIFLAITGTLDAITFLAVIGCAVCSLLTITERTELAYIGGLALISISLILQAVLESKCITCLKADTLILAAVICLTPFQNFKLPAQIMSAVMSVVMFFAVVTVVPVESESTDIKPHGFGQYLEVQETSGEKLTLNTAENPVLLFSPSCSACEKALNKVMEQDADGTKWKLVLSSSKEKDIKKANELLKRIGYTGTLYTYDWHGSVPIVIYTDENDSTIVSHSVDKTIPLL